PTRDALIEAAYRNELTRLCDAVPELLAAQSPDKALRAWMDRYVDYLATKRGMASALQAVIDSRGDPDAHSRDRVTGALRPLLSAGVDAGTRGGDVAAADVFAALSGVALSAGRPEQREQAGRLLDLLLDGLRPRG